MSSPFVASGKRECTLEAAMMEVAAFMAGKTLQEATEIAWMNPAGYPSVRRFEKYPPYFTWNLMVECRAMIKRGEKVDPFKLDGAKIQATWDWARSVSGPMYDGYLAWRRQQSDPIDERWMLVEQDDDVSEDTIDADIVSEMRLVDRDVSLSVSCVGEEVLVTLYDDQGASPPKSVVLQPPLVNAASTVKRAMMEPAADAPVICRCHMVPVLTFDQIIREEILSGDYPVLFHSYGLVFLIVGGSLAVRVNQVNQHLVGRLVDGQQLRTYVAAYPTSVSEIGVESVASMRYKLKRRSLPKMLPSDLSTVENLFQWLLISHAMFPYRIVKGIMYAIIRGTTVSQVKKEQAVTMDGRPPYVADGNWQKDHGSGSCPVQRNDGERRTSDCSESEQSVDNFISSVRTSTIARQEVNHPPIATSSVLRQGGASSLILKVAVSSPSSTPMRYDKESIAGMSKIMAPVSASAYPAYDSLYPRAVQREDLNWKGLLLELAAATKRKVEFVGQQMEGPRFQYRVIVGTRSTQWSGWFTRKKDAERESARLAFMEWNKFLGAGE